MVSDAISGSQDERQASPVRTGYFGPQVG